MSEARIHSVTAREIINGRGLPAVEVELRAGRDIRVRASAPGGISVSEHEAVDLRDGGGRYMGKGVLRAVDNVERIIGPALEGMRADDQEAVDRVMIDLDGTPNKSRLGGNAMTAVSIAAARAGAAVRGQPLYDYLRGERPARIPIICPNLISGSKTAGNRLDFEDFLVVPHGFESVAESIRAVVELFHILYRDLNRSHGTVGQITALAPPLHRNEDALDALSEAVRKAGYEGRVGFGLDVASGLIYNPATGLYELERGPMDADTLIAYYKQLCADYPILFLEDGLEENDFDGFARMSAQLDTLVVGDDLFATNAARIRRGKACEAGDAVLIKVNQAGTVTEALEACDAGRELGYHLVASTRSGETEDPFQADFAVAVGARYMKTGCPFRGEMVTKWNRMMEIERAVGAEQFGGGV